MELKAAENEVEDLRQLYERLRQHSAQLREHLPELKPPAAEASGGNDEDGGAAPRASDTSPAGAAGPPFGNARGVSRAVDSWLERLEALRPRTEALEKRRSAKDPVTGNPRYGANTAKRIDLLLDRYRELAENASRAFETAENDGGTNVSPDAESLDSTLVRSLRRQAATEEEAERQAQEREAERRAREEEARQAEEALRLEVEQREREEAEREAALARAERARHAEEALQAQQRAREEADRADREWVRGIDKGVGGVRAQLIRLVQSTSDDPAAQKTAVVALHTLFAQIVARPEEPSFRRIRRDHPKFNADIGRHPGGKELLIAAGFVLGRIDDVPCFLSKEPNLETDMDGWSSWYDLLKASLEAIEEQLLQTS